MKKIFRPRVWRGLILKKIRKMKAILSGRLVYQLDKILEHLRILKKLRN